MSIGRYVNGSNNTQDDFRSILCYITEDYKTGNGKYVAAHGCSPKRILRDMSAVKKAHHKTHGKQYEHVVISITPDTADKSDLDYMEIGRAIAAYYKEYQVAYALHKDTNVRHLHFVINSVSFQTGKKFSQGPQDLNRFK